MPSIAEIKQQYPDLAGLDDEQVVDAVHQAFYPDLPRDDIASSLGFKPAPPPVPERSALRAVGDVGLSLGQGAIGAFKSLTDLAGADNAASETLGSMSKFLGDQKSEQSKATLKASQERVKAAEESGSTWEEAKAYMGMLLDQPGEFLAQGVGSFATLGLGKIAQAAKLAGAARAAGVSKEAFLASKAGMEAIKEAAKFGFKANVGIGALQGAGAVKGSQYEQTYQSAIQQGMSEEDAAALAAEAQSYGGPGTMQQVLGGALGGVAAATGPIERMVMGRGGQQAATGTMAAIGKGFATEAIPEGAQGAQERFAGNEAAIDAGVLDPSRLYQGVAGQGLMEGTIGGVIGGVAGPFEAQAPINLPNQAKEPVQPPQPLPETGPMTRAFNAGLGPRITNTLTADLLGRSADPLAGQITAERQAAEDSALMRNQFADRNAASLAGGGLEGSRADPLANMLADSRTADANSFTNVQQVANSRPPMPASDAARILEEAKARGMDMTAAPHPDGGYVVVPRQWVTPDMAAQAESEIADTLARMQQADAAPVERAERRRSEPVDLNLNTDPVAGYIEDLRKTNTPAARAYVGEFDAGRVTREDVEQRMQADRGMTADERLAKAAAEGLKLNPKGDPFKTLMAAQRAAKTTPGTVIEVPGGYAIRTRSSSYADTQAQDAAPAEASVEPAGNAGNAAPAVRSAGVPGVDQPQPLDALTDEQDAPQATTGAPATTGAATTEAEAAPVEAPAPARGDGAAAAGVPDARAGAGVRANGVEGITRTILESIADQAKKTNRKYYDKQIAKGLMTRDEADRRIANDDKMWAEQKVNDRTERIAKAIAEKDPTVLVGAWAKEGQGTYGNEGSMEAFRKLTGINLARMNSADRAKAIFDWAGWSEDQVRADVEKRRAERNEQIAKAEEKRKQDDAAGIERLAASTKLTIEGQDGETTVKDYIDGLIEQGYTEVGQTKVGAIKRTLLFRPGANSGYPMRSGILADYAKVASERFKAKQPPAQETKPQSHAERAMLHIRDFLKKFDGRQLDQQRAFVAQAETRFGISKIAGFKGGFTVHVADRNDGNATVYMRGPSGSFAIAGTIPLEETAVYAAPAQQEAKPTEKKAQEPKAEEAAQAQATPQQQEAAEPFEHAGLKIRQSRVKEGDQVVDRWVVQSPENAEREARGERQIGGDRIVETREQAIKTAEQEVKRYAKEKADRAEIDAQDKARRDADEAKKEANRGKTLLERRADAILDKPGKFPASAGLGLGTKREAMDKAIEQGRLVTEVMVDDTAAKKRDQDAVDAVRRAGYILGASNENIPVVKRGLEAQARLKEGKYQKPEYRVYQGSDRNGSFFEITKTEYDYVQKVKASRPAESKPDQETAAKPAQKAENLPEGWDTLKNGYTGLPVYRFNQGAGQPFAVVTRTEIGYEVQIRHGDKLVTSRNMPGAAKFEALDAATQMLGEATMATHKDPGEKAEPATKAVVNEAMKTAAKNEDTKPSEMRKWLLGEIDKALLQAPDRADYDEAVKRMGEKDAVSMFTGNGFLGKNAETGFVTFDVPGDGKFKVRNSTRGLLEFRKNVSASLGFKDSGQKTVKPDQNEGVRNGSGGQMAAIINMIEEGDFEAARDYADAVGIKLEDVKVPRGERKPQWDQFLKDGTLPPATWMPSKEWQFQDFGDSSFVPDSQKKVAILTRVADGSTYMAKVNGYLDGSSATYTLTKDGKEVGRPSSRNSFTEVMRMAEDAMPEANEKPAPSKASDTGWNMAGTGYGGKRYRGRNITTADGLEIVARIYENAGNYDEVEVKVDGVRKFTVRDSYNAQDKADAFVKTLTEQEVGPFGPILTQYRGDAQGAIKALTELKNGEAVAALSHPDVGDIDLVWGEAGTGNKDGFGLSKLVKFHPEVLGDLQGFLSTLKKDPKRSGENRIRLVSEGGEAAVSLNWQGDRKVWLLTAYEKSAGDGTTMNTADVANRDDTTRPDASAMGSVAQPTQGVQDASPKLTPAEATDLMEWQSLGTKDGVTKHILTFYESKADKDAKRGRMIVATVTKGDRSATAWMVDGDDQTFGPLSLAKKRGMEIGMAKAVSDGFVDAAPAQQEAQPASEFGDIEKTLQSKSHEAERQGDVAIVAGGGSVRYVSMDDAVQAVQAAIKSGVLGVPFQIHNATGIRLGDTDRVIKAAQEPATDDRAKPEPVAPIAAKVDDFGEKLPPARRAMAAKLSEELTDDAIASQPLSKVWPLEENEAIEDTFAAAVAHVMREAVPAKPRTSYKVKSWVSKVKVLRDFAAKILRGTVTKDIFMAELAKFSSLRDLGAKIKLLEQIDREQWKRIGDVSEAPGAIQYVDGKAVPQPSASVTVDGRSHWFRNSGDINAHVDAIKDMLTGDAPESKLKFEVFRATTGDRKVFISKKGDKEYRRLMEFDTVEEARKALKDQYADLVTAWEGVKSRDNITERDLRTAENRPRTGKDHRKGRDISAEEFQQTFGFRGGEFGKWVSQGNGAQERQFMLNSAYDALMDLSDIIGVPPKAISLDGTLGVAFGSRGGGWASAHFEPSNLVINLTKPRGAGALAHEWFHALDNYFARKRGGEVPIGRSLDAQNEYRRNNFITHKTRPMMVRKDGKGSPVTRERLAEWRKSSPGSAYLNEDQWIEDPNHKPGVRAEVEERFDELVKALDASPMLKRARKIDGVKLGDGYWSRTLERAARAFENYIQVRMNEQGYHNDFLVNVKPAVDVGKNLDRYPYLLPSEVAPIADAFSNLFNTIQTKEEDGKTVMFSRKSDPAADAVGQWQASLRNAATNPQAKDPSMATPMVLQMMGAKATRLVLPRTYLKAILDKHPDVPAVVFERLPEMLADPLFILPHHQGGLRVILQAETAKGEPVAVGVSVGPDGRIQTVTALNNDPGITGQQRMALAVVRAKGRIYARNKEALDNARASAAAAPGLIPLHRDSDSTANVVTRGDVVKKIQTGEGPGYSRSTANPDGISKKTAADVVDAIRSRWANSPEVVVVSDMQDPAVPQRVREADLEQRSMGATGEPEGFWYGGKVYIVSGALSTPGDVVRVLFHESLGHYGLRGVFGESLTPILRQIASLRRNEIVVKAFEYGLVPKNLSPRATMQEVWAAMSDSQRLQAAEEVLAVMAQTKPEMGYVKRALAAIRAWLRKNVPGFQGMKLTDGEIIQQYILPARRFVEQGSGQVRQGPMAPAPAFVRGQGGIDQTQTPEFKRWYGDWEAGASDARGLFNGRGNQDVNAVQRRGGVEKNSDRTTRVWNYTFSGASGPVGADGKPVVFFHGTREDFSVFELNHPLRHDKGWLGRGVYVASDALDAESYARMRRGTGSPNVMPLYVAVKNPYLATNELKKKLRRATQESIDKFTQDLKDQGYDGVVMPFEDGHIELMAFEPAQVKSAIGNNGQFDPNNADIRFSRASVREVYQDLVPEALRDRLTDIGTSQRGFNRWWHTTVGTQLHKAKINKDFGRVYYAVQDFMKDVSRMATNAADLAPDLLPQIDGVGDIRKMLPKMTPAGYRQRKADLKAASDALFDGTLRYTRDGYGEPVEAQNTTDAGIVWTDEELRARGLNEQAIKLYRQARSAINLSLDNLMASDVYRMLTLAEPETLARTPQEHADLMAKIRKAAASDKPNQAVSMAAQALDGQADQLRKQIKELEKQGKQDPETQGITEAIAQAKESLKAVQDIKKRLDDKFERVSELKAQGYAPLSRFGRYAVDVLDEDGNRAFFGLYETQYEANRAARRFSEQGFQVSQSVKSVKEFEMLKGLSPETAMLFAELLGVEKDQAMQVWLQNALAEQSALKRQIRRKGVEGFDEDASRVVAAFITSNSRAASRALHALRIQEGVDNVRQGDVKDEAKELADYVNNPKEEAQAIRSLLFFNYIGGSISSALVNLTQTVVQTFPYLSQYGGARKSAARVTSAMKLAMGKIDDAELAAAVKRAEEDGVIKPQEVFQLQAEASRTLGSNLYARTGLALWGSFFQIAETFNRRVAFIAAYQTAKQEGIANPFAFAENAVDETQSVFNKGSRPNWARGALGATLFTFKTFTVQYVEFLKRLPPKERALALGVLVLLAGFRGLPFAEDAEDLVDTVAQGLGYNFTTKEQMDRFLVATLGRPFADFLQHGASGTGLIPFDVSQRLGMSDLLPGTGLLKASETRKEDQVLEVVGVAGSFVRDALKGEFRPIAIRNAAKAVEMYDQGIYTDTRGRKVMDVTPVDAAFKSIGLQPSAVAAESRAVRTQYEKRALFTKVKSEISEQIALGQFENDKDKIQKARERLADWNEKNPEARIVLNTQAIRRRVVEMRRDRTERFIRSSPRELRAQLVESMQ